MTKNILNYAFRIRKTAISKLMIGSHELGISNNLSYYDYPRMESYLTQEEVLEVLSLKKWITSSSAKKSFGLQKNFIYYTGSRNMRKYITACDSPEKNVCKFSGQDNLQFLLKTKKAFYLFLCKIQRNCTFLVVKNVEFNKNQRQSFIYFNFKNWIYEKISKQMQSRKRSSKEQEKENWGGPEIYSLIVFIKDDIDEILNKNPSVLLFYSAHWCQYCRNLKKIFGKAAFMAKEANLPVIFATFDVTTNHDIADEMGIIGVPVIKYYSNGKFVSDFKGKRTSEALFEFVKDPPKTS